MALLSKQHSFFVKIPEDLVKLFYNESLTEIGPFKSYGEAHRYRMNHFKGKYLYKQCPIIQQTITRKEL